VAMYIAKLTCMCTFIGLSPKLPRAHQTQKNILLFEIKCHVYIKNLFRYLKEYI